MASMICPFCNVTMAINYTVEEKYKITKRSAERLPMLSDLRESLQEDHLLITTYECPSCGKLTVIAKGKGEDFGEIDMYLQPTAVFKRFPNYIPSAIISDYEEAHLILKLSPKASATLSRRCLQGMIHDYWNIQEKTLNAEILSLQSKVSPQLWQVLDSVRKIGNIGAHMENYVNLIVEINPDEAEKLLKLLEFLIEQWYINRHEQDKLFNEIIGISEDKQSQRIKPKN